MSDSDELVSKKLDALRSMCESLFLARQEQAEQIDVILAAVSARALTHPNRGVLEEQTHQRLLSLRRVRLGDCACNPPTGHATLTWKRIFENDAPWTLP